MMHQHKFSILNHFFEHYAKTFKFALTDIELQFKDP